MPTTARKNSIIMHSISGTDASPEYSSILSEVLLDHVIKLDNAYGNFFRRRMAKGNRKK